METSLILDEVPMTTGSFPWKSDITSPTLSLMRIFSKRLGPVRVVLPPVAFLPVKGKLLRYRPLSFQRRHNIA